MRSVAPTENSYRRVLGSDLAGFSAFFSKERDTPYLSLRQGHALHSADVLTSTPKSCYYSCEQLSCVLLKVIVY